MILGGPATTWYEDYAPTQWALVDLDRSRVVRRGDLGIDAAEYGAFLPDGIHAVAVGRQSQFVVLDTLTGEATVPPTKRVRGSVYALTYELTDPAS